MCSLNPLSIPYVMQDRDSNRGKDEAKRGTIGQAHLIQKTKSTYLQLQQQLIMHVYKSKNERRATTEYNCYTGTLTQFYFTRLVPHTHTFTQNPKETKVATSLCAHRVLLLRLQLPAPPAWSVSSCFAPHVLAARHHGRGFGNEPGFRRGFRCLNPQRGWRGETVDTRGRERGMADAPSH